MTKKMVPVQAKIERKRYSPEFKQQALLRVVKDGVPVAARDLGLEPAQLYAWRAKAQQQGQDEEENAFLKKSGGVLRGLCVMCNNPPAGAVDRVLRPPVETTVDLCPLHPVGVLQRPHARQPAIGWRHTHHALPPLGASIVKSPSTPHDRHLGQAHPSPEPRRAPLPGGRYDPPDILKR